MRPVTIEIPDEAVVFIPAFVLKRDLQQAGRQYRAYFEDLGKTVALSAEEKARELGLLPRTEAAPDAE